MKYLINNVYIIQESNYWYIKAHRNISIRDWVHLLKVIDYCVKQDNSCYETNDNEVQFDSEESAKKFISNYMEPYITMLTLCDEL